MNLKIFQMLFILIIVCQQNICFVQSNKFSVHEQYIHFNEQSAYSNIRNAFYYSNTKINDTAKVKKYKDPKLALFLAIVPGSVARGLGHWYAGKSRTGSLLFLINTSVLIFAFTHYFTPKEDYSI